MIDVLPPTGGIPPSHLSIFHSVYRGSRPEDRAVTDKMPCIAPNAPAAWQSGGGIHHPGPERDPGKLVCLGVLMACAQDFIHEEEPSLLHSFSPQPGPAGPIVTVGNEKLQMVTMRMIHAFSQKVKTLAGNGGVLEGSGRKHDIWWPGGRNSPPRPNTGGGGPGGEKFFRQIFPTAASRGRVRFHRGGLRAGLGPAPT